MIGNNSPLSPSCPWTKVASVSSDERKKRLSLEDGQKLEVHRFACVGAGDLVSCDTSGKVWVKTQTGDIPVLPSYTQSGLFEAAPGISFSVTISELITDAQIQAHRALAQ